jgi:uracil-DNA glycosylase
MGEGGATFDPGCRQCLRLAGFLDEIRGRYPDYHCRPVAPFGSARHRLLIVGLAPGMHGANRTGRPFTGDHAGILLYRTLHDHGFASAAESVSGNDGLRLRDCRITNAVKCLPPANKPLPVEVRQCNGYLAAEIAAVPGGGVIVALGAIAHGAVLRALGIKPAQARFAHGALHELPRHLRLLDSYHCSRYNTHTRRMTAPMFEKVFAHAQSLLAG